MVKEAYQILFPESLAGPIFALGWTAGISLARFVCVSVRVSVCGCVGVGVVVGVGVGVGVGTYAIVYTHLCTGLDHWHLFCWSIRLG